MILLISFFVAIFWIGIRSTLLKNRFAKRRDPFVRLTHTAMAVVVLLAVQVALHFQDSPLSAILGIAALLLFSLCTVTSSLKLTIVGEVAGEGEKLFPGIHQWNLVVYILGIAVACVLAASQHSRWGTLLLAASLGFFVNWLSDIYSHFVHSFKPCPQAGDPSSGETPRIAALSLFYSLTSAAILGAGALYVSAPLDAESQNRESIYSTLLWAGPLWIVAYFFIIYNPKKTTHRRRTTLLTVYCATFAASIASILSILPLPGVTHLVDNPDIWTTIAMVAIITAATAESAVLNMRTLKFEPMPARWWIIIAFASLQAGLGYTVPLLLIDPSKSIHSDSVLFIGASFILAFGFGSLLRIRIANLHSSEALSGRGFTPNPPSFNVGIHDWTILSGLVLTIGILRQFGIEVASGWLAVVFGVILLTGLINFLTHRGSAIKEEEGFRLAALRDFAGPMAEDDLKKKVRYRLLWQYASLALMLTLSGILLAQ